MEAFFLVYDLFSQYMIDIHQLRKDPQRIYDALEKRGKEEYISLAKEVYLLDKKFTSDLRALEVQQARLNQVSKAIALHYRSNSGLSEEKLSSLKAEGLAFKEQIRLLTENTQEKKADLEAKAYMLPNIPSSEVRAGAHAADHELIFQSETRLPLSASPLPHWETTKDWIDFDSASKVTGRGFSIFRGRMAKLVRGMINFFLDKAVSEGYEEVSPPLLVKESSARNTGQMPDKEEQMYKVSNAPYYLIPTAEVSLTNMCQGQFFRPEQLPLRVAGYTPCFRREAGSWGTEARGLNRLHQFDKVEIVQICHPKDAKEAMEGMLAHVRGLLSALELPYRVLKLCGKDLGFASALTYDVEVFSPGQKRWLEVSSVSLFNAFQSRRLRMKYRENGHLHFPYTLNGSALAIPRTLASMLEYQQKGDDFVLPKVLQNYCGFDKL